MRYFLIDGAQANTVQVISAALCFGFHSSAASACTVSQSIMVHVLSSEILQEYGLFSSVAAVELRPW